MKRTIGILFLILIGLGLLELTPAEVTHEDIRGTLQSLVYSYNQLDNKLERHEHRERALGELLKKAMQALQKGQKNLEPINGIFQRLDERVSQIETMLITQEDKYNLQTEKLAETLDHIFKWMRENDECFRRPLVPDKSAVLAPIVTASPVISPEFIEQQQNINKEMLEQIKKLSTNVEKLLDTSKGIMEHTELTFKSVPSTAEMLTKIEDKLVSYNVAPVTVKPESADFESKILERVFEISTGIAELKSIPRSKQGLTIEDKNFIQYLNNNTLSALQIVQAECQIAPNKAIDQTALQIKDFEQNTINTISTVIDSVSQSSNVLEKFYKDVNGSYGKLDEALELFSNFSGILLTNSDLVLGTQRKVEFGTIQVVQKISDLLDKRIAELTLQVKERFENIEESIESNQMEAMQNLSSRIEPEISRVWHQISIMHDEISDSKDLLTILHGRHEAFVNTTFSTMDSAGSKVETIKDRVIDIEENLNFLLGKLKLMSQEFSNIKVGLAESLEELRDEFRIIQEKMPSLYTVPKNQYETEVNLLKKRSDNTS